ncbi:MAG: hypothetical protein J6B75_00280 [Ruminococcus sp.]|nr:hypothetical protein [Ruminococcus sp.]
MKAFFSNVWTKRFVSLIAALYTVAVCFLCYYSIFYDIHIESRASVCMIVSALSVIALILMLYTRNQLVTKISSFVILTAMLPVVLLYFDEKALLIPIVATGVIILLLSGAGEGKKTLFGTIILLMYIFGALGYFLFTSFFVTHAKQEVIEKGLSPSGRYRYEIINTEDTSGGSTAIYLEPNYADVTYPFVTFTLKDMEHICYQERPICENVQLEWSTQTRAAITEQLNNVSNNIKITLTDSELERYGITIDSRLQISGINVYKLMEIGKTASDVDPLKLDTLDETQLAAFDIGKDEEGYYVLEPDTEFLAAINRMEGERIYLSELDGKGREAFNESHLDELGYTLFELEKNNEVLLSSLSDEQLAELGVSEEGDVLSFNGKVCFRFYVAELEDYFDTDSRKFSVNLLT